MIPATSLFLLLMQEYAPIDFTTIIWIGVIAIVAFLLERLFSRQIRKFGKKAGMQHDVTNNMVLTARLFLLFLASVLIIRFAGVPTDILVAISAILGSAIGFASNKTIGNFIAGFFLLAARPLKVGDYVRVGAIEGFVAEIAINYTKILNMDSNIVAISNLQLLDRDITNYRYHDETLGEQTYCYNFEMGFSHAVPVAKMEEILAEVLAEQEGHSKAPRFTLDRTDHNGRFYRIFIYVDDPRQIYEKRNVIAKKVMAKWDSARLGT